MRILLTILCFLSLSCTKAQTGILGPARSLLSLNPAELTWTEGAEFNVRSLMDENFIHYTSNYASTVAEVSAVTGSAPSLSGGKLSVGSGIYKTTTAPKVNFWSVEMTINNSISGQLGPCVVLNSTNYVAGVYDQGAGELKIIVNGSAIMTKTHTLSTTNLKLTLTLMKNALNLWAQEGSADPIFIGHVESSVNLGADGLMPTCRYGVYSTGTNTVAALRGGANGGYNIFNQRWVRNSDGSPYIHEGKALFTGDWTALGETTTLGQAYRYANQCVFSFDVDAYLAGGDPEDLIEAVGHIYVKRDEPGDATVRYYGGQDMKLTYYAATGQFLMTTVLCDHYNSAVVPQTDDPYVWMDPEEIFTETIVDESRFNTFGFGGSKLIYDVTNVLYKDGTYYVPAGETDTNRGTSWSVVTPILFTGSSLSSLTATRYSTSTFLELASWARLGGVDYLLYQTFGDNNNYAFTAPGLSPLGRMQIGSASSTTPGFIGGFDFIPWNVGANTKYILFGFDTDNATLVDVDGVSKFFYYSLGNCRILVANEQSTSHEY